MQQFKLCYYLLGLFAEGSKSLITIISVLFLEFLSHLILPATLSPVLPPSVSPVRVVARGSVEEPVKNTINF